MAEEMIDNSTPTSDDLDVLRVLLHTIKGISPISTTENYASIDTSDEPALEN